MIFSTKPSRRETLWGGIYLILYVFVMSWLVPFLVRLSGAELDAAQVNFVYFTVNFAATTVIFREFALRSLKEALRSPVRNLWYALLGYLGNLILSSYVVMFIVRIEPEFANVNDMAINAMVAENFVLMGIGAVILAPITEELLFRGLVFRGLYDRSPVAAHLVSIVLFSAIHISSYVGAYEPKILLLCFIQYVPAAYCLNFAYRQGGSILAPILMHMLTNLVSLLAMR